MEIKRIIPWWIKIIMKIVLSRFNLSYNKFWKRLGLFVNGPMEDSDYALGVFERHYRYYSKKPFVCLELGCGDSLATAIIAKFYGSTKTYLVDVGCYATQDIGSYKTLAHKLEVNIGNSIESYMEACNVCYLTNGLQSLKTIPDNSVDFIFSQAVLEHIRKREFEQTLVELRRILKNDGKMSHSIDLKDHLGGGLNNLRFSQSWWEKEWVASSGFYTNRLRYSEMNQVFKDAGFNYEITDIIRFSEFPLKRKKMAPEFLTLSDDDLFISGFDVVLD